MEVALTIGDFSRMMHLSVKTLRYHHHVGLLEPAEIDPGTGYRYYATDQVPTGRPSVASGICRCGSRRYGKS